MPTPSQIRTLHHNSALDQTTQKPDEAEVVTLTGIAKIGDNRLTLYKDTAAQYFIDNKLGHSTSLSLGFSEMLLEAKNKTRQSEVLRDILNKIEHGPFIHSYFEAYVILAWNGETNPKTIIFGDINHVVAEIEERMKAQGFEVKADQAATFTPSSHG